MATLEIVFLGLIAFAPNGAGSLFALWPETKDCPPCENIGCDRDEDYPRHYPMLAASISAGPAISVSGDGCPTAYQDKTGKYNLYDLSGQDISGNWDTAALDLKGEPPTNTPDGQVLGNYDWTARANRIAPHLKKVMSACVGSGTWGNCSLVARLKINRGTVSTECVVPRTPNPMAKCDGHWNSPKLDPKFTTFCFSDGAYDCPGMREDFSLSEGTLLKLEGLGPDPVLQLKNREGDCRVTVSVPAGGSAKIYLLHQVAREEIKVGCGADSHVHEKSFRYFYSLAASLPGAADCPKVPFPYPQVVCGTGSSPRCPSLLFQE